MAAGRLRVETFLQGILLDYWKSALEKYGGFMSIRRAMQ